MTENTGLAVVFAEGDLVSACLPGSRHEQIGGVLETNCTFDQEYNDEEDTNDHSNSQVMEVSITRRDGILVHFPVDNCTATVPPERVKKMGQGDDGTVASPEGRRSTRTRRSVVTPSPTLFKTEGKKGTAAGVAGGRSNKGTNKNVEEDKKPAAKRKRGKAEPEPSPSSEDESFSEFYSNADIQKKEKAKQVVAGKQGANTKTTTNAKAAKKAAPSRRKANNDSKSEDASNVICLPVASPPPPAKKNAARKGGTKKATGAPQRAPLIVLPDDSEEEEEPDPVAAAAEEEESDTDDRPFQVEYSVSSRSTCRRCDAVIQKGDVRISHVPLFRGKPGFRVYRHLPCAVFSEEVEKVSDVGGWRQLAKADLKRLRERVEESARERDEENQELQPDELVQAAFTGELRPSPPGLSANLLPFQKEGFSWMRHQEKMGGQIRGGILADEMGMGKTLQTIATILDNRPMLQHSKPGMKHPPSSPDLETRIAEERIWGEAKESWQLEMEKLDVSSRIMPKKNRAGARAGTLVVCPVIALHQWKSEIEKFTDNDKTLTVGTYHGPNRAKEMPAEVMSKYDVILTTYQCLEQDFRKMMSPNKVACPNCGGKFKIDKLSVHLKYFCGENAQRTEAQARQRRTADRNRQGGQRPSGQSGGGKDKSKKPKKSMTKSKTPPATKVPPKKKVRVSGDDIFDSDSGLSAVGDAVSKGRKRPSRSGTMQTKQKITKCMKSGDRDTDSSGSKYGTEDDDDLSSDESDSSEDTKLVELKKKSSKAVRSAKGGARNAADIAREKQRQALESAASKKGKKVSPKNKATDKKKKKPDADSSSDDESQGGKGGFDPIDDIDMDVLIEEAMSGARFSILHSFCWHRIVLDEAHFIKSRSSQTAAAAFSLTGIHRWCLSGTPLQNRVGEFYSLIRFLRLDPMAYYFCRQKGCSCKSIHYRFRDGRCRDCGHRPFSHFAHFNKHVLNAIQRDGYTGDGRRAMFKLKSEVLDKYLIRRTKESRAEDMNLPPRIVTIRPIRLHPVEKDFYESLYTQTRASFDDYVAEGSLLNNYAHIFDLLTKLRQSVDHPYLIVHSKTNSKKLAAQGVPISNGSVECDICHEIPTERVASSCCGAGFCRTCVVEYIEGAGEGAEGASVPCPSCRAPFSVDLQNQVVTDVVDDGTLDVGASASSSSHVPSLKELSHVPSGSILRRINLANFATSTKIEALIQELVSMRKARPGSKALVFSQFVNMLDLIRWRLHSDPSLEDMGLGVRILHGGMNVHSRDAALKDFREDSNVRILLMSLKAGGVALNLTVASEVYLVDNWWNPAAEMQAIDRTHRLGQYRPIRAVRFIAEGTVEERVLQLQEKKRLVFDGTVGRDAGSLKMLTVDDMKSLFC